MKLKIMCYNIKRGFRELEPPHKSEEKRKKLAQKVVEKENPDVLVLNEAYFIGKNSKIKEDYQKIFPFKYYKAGEHKKGLLPFWGDAVLSKYPITDFQNLSYGHLALLRMKIKIEDDILNLDAIHISPIPVITKSYQKELISYVLKGKSMKNYILAGDFNAVSPKDKYNKEELRKAWKNIIENGEKVIDEMIEGKTISVVLNKGLIDMYRENNKRPSYTIPTDLLSKNKSSGVRVDHIFCTNDFKVIDSYILKNKLTEKASDHYPVVAVLELK